MIRTITSWAVYLPAQRRILNGFRTRKDMDRFYGKNRIPIGTVLVKMQGTYAEGMIRTKRRIDRTIHD